MQAYPLDLVRTRLAAQTQGNYYHGIFPTMRRIVADEGAVGLYRGLGATLLQVGLVWLMEGYVIGSLTAMLCSLIYWRRMPVVHCAETSSPAMCSVCRGSKECPHVSCTMYVTTGM